MTYYPQPFIPERGESVGHSLTIINFFNGLFHRRIGPFHMGPANGAFFKGLYGPAARGGLVFGRIKGLFSFAGAAAHPPGGSG